MIIILTATTEEYMLARKYLPEYFVLLTGVGASNVIKTLTSISQNPDTTDYINVGFCGSNKLPIGTVTTVARTFRLMDKTVEFEDFRNGYELTHLIGRDCYTSNSFVTKITTDEPVLYDMDLNYIAAFPIKLKGSVKIVSDNLDVAQYATTIDTTTPEIWDQVRKCVEAIACMNKK